jgi:hypothetical protein
MNTTSKDSPKRAGGESNGKSGDQDLVTEAEMESESCDSHNEMASQNEANPENQSSQMEGESESESRSGAVKRECGGGTTTASIENDCGSCGKCENGGSDCVHKHASSNNSNLRSNSGEISTLQTHPKHDTITSSSPHETLRLSSEQQGDRTIKDGLSQHNTAGADNIPVPHDESNSKDADALQQPNRTNENVQHNHDKNDDDDVQYNHDRNNDNNVPVPSHPSSISCSTNHDGVKHDNVSIEHDIQEHDSGSKDCDTQEHDSGSKDQVACSSDGCLGRDARAVNHDVEDHEDQHKHGAEETKHLVSIKMTL